MPDPTPVTNPDGPVAVEATLAPAPLLAQVPTHELAWMVRGLTLTFWGCFALLGAVIETLLVGAFRPLVAITGVLGAASIAAGAAWLVQPKTVGAHWRRSARALLVTGIATTYLTPFAWMWRQAPLNPYFFWHGVAWAGAFIAHLALINELARAFGRLAGSRSLTWQAIGFGLTVLCVLFIPYLFAARTLGQCLATGYDPIRVIQFRLTHLSPNWLLVVLAPVSLTMSLLWTTKDCVWERLTARPADPILPVTRP